MSSSRGKHSKPNKKSNNKFLAFFVMLYVKFMAMSLTKRIISLALAVVILVVACIVTPLGLDVVQILSKWNKENYQQVEDPDIIELQPINEKIVNIALFGIDTRSDSGESAFIGNSDSIMIVSLNTETGDIKLMSIMRDSYLPIVTDKDTSGEYKTYNYKVNTAYAGGGAERAIKTLNYNFGLDIKNYATVNFQGMADIIDAVGGIEIEVRQAEINANNGLNHNIREQASIIGIDPSKHLVTKAGVQKLSGIQAVAWARIRSVATLDGVGNDYGRTDRQRLVMEKLLDKALAMKATEYPSFIKKILPYMRTSVSPGYAASLATTVLTKKVTFEQARIPHNKIIITDNAITTAGSSVYFDPEDAKAIIHAFIYDDIAPDEFLKTYTPKKRNWANISLGGSGGGNEDPTVPTDPSDPSAPDVSSDPNSSEDTSSADSSETTSSEEQNTSSDGAELTPPPTGGEGSEDGSSLPPPLP